MKFGILPLLAGCAFLLLPEARAQNFSVDWYKVAGGGGSSTGGLYAISGTVGQPDASASGTLSGGAYALTGGFWSLISVAQTPGAPILYIAHASNIVTVFWQVVPGWNLYQDTSLDAPLVNWSASSGITTSSGTNYLKLVNPDGNLFFRLGRNNSVQPQMDTDEHR